METYSSFVGNEEYIQVNGQASKYRREGRESGQE